MAEKGPLITKSKDRRMGTFDLLENSLFRWNLLRISETAQWTKVCTVKPDVQSLFPGTHMMEEEN